MFEGEKKLHRVIQYSQAVAQDRCLEKFKI